MFLGVYMTWFFIYSISLDHDLMASIWEKDISNLAGNLNSSRSYLNTAVEILIFSMTKSFSNETYLAWKFSCLQFREHFGRKGSVKCLWVFLMASSNSPLKFHYIWSKFSVKNLILEIVSYLLTLFPVSQNWSLI